MKQVYLFFALLALPMMASAQGTTIVSTDSLVQKAVWREAWTEINRNGEISEDNESNL